MRTVAVLPVKRFGRAKQRLSPAFGGRQRRALAEAMVADVLSAITAVDALEATIVVSRERRVQLLAREHGALVIDDRDEAGQSSAAAAGLGRAIVLGAERVLLVPGDTPAIDPREISRLLAREPRAARDVTIVPDRHGTGTNALLLAPPTALAPTFGPGSCARHLAQAEQAGADVRVESVRSLAYDVDTAEDLDALRAELRARPGRAPRTTRTIERIGTGVMRSGRSGLSPQPGALSAQ